MQKHRRIVIVSAAAAALAGALLIWHHQTKPYHFYAVTPGVLYRSGLLAPDDLESVIRRYGIKTVVNLRSRQMRDEEDWFSRERAVCRANGAELVDIPILSGTLPDGDQRRQWLELFKAKEKLPVLVHCNQGVLRTGMMVAVYQMECLGQSTQEALEQVRFFGRRGKTAEILKNFILNYPRAGDQTSTRRRQSATLQRLIAI